MVTIEELHRCMGHIAPETVKQMVSNGTIKGIEIDSATTIQHCDSCEYTKATRKPIMKLRERPNSVMKSIRMYGDPHLYKPPGIKNIM